MVQFRMQPLDPFKEIEIETAILPTKFFSWTFIISNA